jgi:hypothetical protein
MFGSVSPPSNVEMIKGCRLIMDSGDQSSLVAPALKKTRYATQPINPNRRFILLHHF